MEKYVIQKGDTLWKIAKTHNISLEVLIAANPQIKDVNAIVPGMKINIPQQPISPGDPGQEENDDMNFTCSVCDTAKQERPFIYGCAKDDTIDKIARRFGVEKAMLLFCNPQLKDRRELEFGTKLMIPGLDPALSAKQTPFCYVGDNDDDDDDGGTPIPPTPVPPTPIPPPGSGCCICPYCGKKLRVVKC